MNKFGPHWQQFTSEMERLITEWQPPMGTWVDPNPEGLARIRSVAPSMFVIGRKNEEGTWDSPNLKDRAYWWADRCAEMGRCDAYYCWNEPLWHGDLAKFSRFDDFQCWFLERMRSQHNMEAVAFNFGTGNFTKDGPDIRASFPNSCDLFKHFGGHEYDWIVDPTLRPMDADRLGYYWNRWPYWLNSIGRDDVTLWVTECGMTQAVHEGRPDEGWRSKTDGMTDGDYITWASWYNSQLVQDKRIGGAALFNFAGYGWQTFEHLGWGRLPEILALDAQAPPEVGGKMDIKVFDMEGAERDWAWAVEKYGVAYRRADVAIGEQVYRLVELREKSGNASLITKVVDGAGNPTTEMDVAFYWPDAPDPPDPPTELLPHDWYRNFKHGLTNENGDVGPGMGTGAYHGIGEGGPHAVWVRDPDIPSDICEKLGMLAGTFHDHLDQVLQLTVKTGEEPPTGDLAAEVDAIADRLKEIAQQMGDGITEIVVKRTGTADQVFVKKAESGVMARIRALLGR